jgi:fructokinase
MILVIGEILFDQFPNYRKLGGAPFNFAYHLIKFGFPVRFISRIGADKPGDQILNNLRKKDFPSDDVQIDNAKSTGMVNVELATDGEPKFHILPDVAYDHIAYGNIFESMDDDVVKLIYFGSLIQRSDEGYSNLQAFLESIKTGTECLFDINLRPNCINEKAVIDSLRKANLLKLNIQEFEFLRAMIGQGMASEQFVDHLFERYSIEIIALTKGDDGSELFLPQGHYAIKSRKVERLSDTVGAGDAYAAILAIGHIRKWHPKDILDTATEFASRICEIEGAIPPSNEFYSIFISEQGSLINDPQDVV